MLAGYFVATGFTRKMASSACSLAVTSLSRPRVPIHLNYIWHGKGRGVAVSPADERNGNRCGIMDPTKGDTNMPVEVREKVRAVSRDVGGQAKLARLIGVSPSRISRWLQNEAPDIVNQRKVEGVEFVLSRLLGTWKRETALKWLQGFNAHLGDRRPIDLLASGRVAEVIEAIESEETGAYA